MEGADRVPREGGISSALESKLKAQERTVEERGECEQKLSRKTKGML